MEGDKKGDSDTSVRDACPYINTSVHTQMENTHTWKMLQTYLCKRLEIQVKIMGENRVAALFRVAGTCLPLFGYFVCKTTLFYRIKRKVVKTIDK